MKTKDSNDKQQSPTVIRSSDLLAAWYEKLKVSAKRKNVEWLITDAESYRDYFEDGCTPEETLDEEIEAARDYC